jgi:hypothetical protein
MAATSGRAAGSGHLDKGPPAATAWTGWIVFAGVMLIMSGGWQMIMGFVALFDDGIYLVGSNGLAVDVDFNAWGWWHLLIGAALVLAGGGLLAGNMVARFIGVIVAMLGAITNLLFIAANPFWSTILIALDVLVIYAIIVHGREVKSI